MAGRKGRVAQENRHEDTDGSVLGSKITQNKNTS